MTATTDVSRHDRTLERLAELGLKLPTPAAPVTSYVPAVRAGNLIFTSGQLPLSEGGLAGTGKVGAEVSTDEAAELARLCTLNALAAASALADLDSIRIVKVVGFVSSADGFTGQPAVINGASDLLLEIFGERGEHARSAVGMAELPLNAPVEVELVVEVS